jgi:hypothetical protein
MDVNLRVAVRLTGEAIMSDKPMDLHHAEMLARQKAYTLWPELVGVAPTVAPRQRFLPPNGHSPAPGAARAQPGEGEEFVFTFRGQIRTPEGHLLPRIAHVVINTQRGVVKEIVSK